MSRWIAGCAVAVVIVVGSGCGDDDVPLVDAGIRSDASTPSDAGQSDAGAVEDAGNGDAGGPPREFDECNPYAEERECGEDEACKLVRDPLPDESATDIYFGCVLSSLAPVGPGLSCSRRVAIPESDAFTDACREGSYCTEDGVFQTCRPLCGTEGEAFQCDRGSERCARVPGTGMNGIPVFAICRTAADCDPIAQTGCPEEEACYALGNGNAVRDVIGDCFAFVPPEGQEDPSELGGACNFINNCVAGLTCLGTPDGEGGFNTDDRECRSYCDPMAEPDAAGACPEGQTCEPLVVDEEGGMFQTPTHVGVCFAAG